MLRGHMACGTCEFSSFPSTEYVSYDAQSGGCCCRLTFVDALEKKEWEFDDANREVRVTGAWTTIMPREQGYMPGHAFFFKSIT